MTKQMKAAGKRKADEFQAFADGVRHDADRCVILQTRPPNLELWPRISPLLSAYASYSVVST